MMEKILQLKSINKEFNGIQVLFDVDLTLHAGEVLCLVGENGAGKSTLIKILSGAEMPNSGVIELFGKEYHRGIRLGQAITAGVATIYQDADLVDTLTVADNVFLGEEIKKRGLIDWQKQEQITRKLIDDLGLKLSASALVEELSPGQKQCVQIVKAIKQDARLLIMDEPTSSLGKEETEALMKLVRRLAEEGRGIIYISHFMEEVFRIGDRALVLKDGHCVSNRTISETNEEQLVTDMVGRAAGSFYHRRDIEKGTGLLEIQNYSGNGIVKDVSFTVRQGEIFGLGGLVGAGRTELVRMIFGCDRKESGRLMLNGKEITPMNPAEAVKKGICMIFENRKEESMFSIRPVRENITITSNEKREFLNLQKEEKTVMEQVEKLHMKVFDSSWEAGKLSGGNQQKMVLSRWLVDEGEVYIFDEPTKGVDVGAKEEIYKQILQLAERGKYIIVVSSVLPELISLSDRIGVMREGRLTAVIDRAEAKEDRLLKEFIGMK